MTNQEAIEILKIERDHMVPTLLPERIEAMDMAISALQAQDVPDINDGDMISRQRVIDELKRYFHDEYYQRTSIQDCIDCFIEDILIKLPSAQSKIIRCKDCKNIWRSGTATIKEVPTKIYRCKLWDRAVSEKGFCYMAERRTDELGDS